MSIICLCRRKAFKTDKKSLTKINTLVKRQNYNKQYFQSFTFNLNETYTFYSYIFGTSFAYLSYFCTNQSIAQRLQSCKNKSDAKK